MKNKFIVIISTLLLLITGCSTNTASTQDSKKLKVVTTIFPPYDFTKEISQGLVDVKMLLKPGAESHSYEPTPQDIKDIQDADLFIYTGGENDYWVETILESFKDKKPQVIKMIDTVEVKTEEIIEGMEHEHNHDHDHEHDEIHLEDIQDRPLSDFKGSFITLTDFIERGILDEVLEHHAEEEQVTLEKIKEEYLTLFKTEYKNISISENGVTLTDSEIPYTYNGYKTVETEDGEIAGVWYIYESKANPKYIALSDHEISSQNEHEGVKHLHMAFLEDLEQLNNLANIPFYVDASATDEQIVATFNHESEGEIDEHVWTSPINAIKIVEAIKTKLIELDPTNKDAYETNTTAYVTKLKELDTSFREVINSSANKTVIFGDRFPFRYFADEYGLSYYAAFTGCSTDSEASPQTIAFLIDKTNSENLPVVFSIELSNGKIADSIAEATGAKRLTLYSCHNVTKEQLESGASYLSMMQENVESLKEALK